MPLVALIYRAGLLSVSVKAVAAINRPVALRYERNLCGLAALRANRIVHLAGLASAAAAAAAIAVSLAGITAVLATNRFVGKTLFGKEFLVARREHKIFAAVPAL
jgi:hypothetical protein